MNVLIYVLASVAALYTGVIVSSRFEVKYYSDRLLIIALVFLVQIILSTLFLGVIVQRLYAPELFVLNVSLSAAIWIVCGRRLNQGSYENFITSVSGFFSEIRASVFALVLLLLVLVQIIWTLFHGKKARVVLHRVRKPEQTTIYAFLRKSYFLSVVKEGNVTALYDRCYSKVMKILLSSEVARSSFLE